MIQAYERIVAQNEAICESKCQEHMAEMGVTSQEVWDAGDCEQARCKLGCPFFKR